MYEYFGKWRPKNSIRTARSGRICDRDIERTRALAPGTLYLSCQSVRQWYRTSVCHDQVLLGPLLLAPESPFQHVFLEWYSPTNLPRSVPEEIDRMVCCYSRTGSRNLGNAMPSQRPNFHRVRSSRNSELHLANAFPSERHTVAN